MPSSNFEKSRGSFASEESSSAADSASCFAALCPFFNNGLTLENVRRAAKHGVWIVVFRELESGNLENESATGLSKFCKHTMKLDILSLETLYKFD